VDTIIGFLLSEDIAAVNKRIRMLLNQVSLPPSLSLSLSPSPFSLSSLSPLSLGTCIPRYLQMDAMMSHVCMQMDADLKQVVDVMKEYFENLGGDAQGV